MRTGVMAGMSGGSWTTVRQQYRPSLTRILLAVLTCGLSLPFTGIRVVRKTTFR